MPTLESLFAEYDELAQDVAGSKPAFFQGNLTRWLTFLDGTATFAQSVLQQLETPADFKGWFEPYRLVAMGHGTRTLE
jgi:hypothetical protein